MRAKNNTLQALLTANDVIQFSHSIMLDELTREMASTSRSISFERKKGVEVMKPEHLLEEAGRALKEGAFEKAFENLKEAGTSLKQLSIAHVEIYDRIVDISTLLEEADSQGIDTRKATDLLLKTKRMFESGRYADARATSTAAYAETEVIVAPFMATRKIQEGKELVLAMRTLNLDTATAEATIQAASELEGGESGEGRALFDAALYWSLAAAQAADASGRGSAAADADQTRARILAVRQLSAGTAEARAALQRCRQRTPDLG